MHVACYAAKSMQRAVAVAIVSLAACLPGCAARAPVAAPGGSGPRILETREGLASYYGKEFHGRRTASGIRFDMNAMVAAHPSYPFGTASRHEPGERSVDQCADRGSRSGTTPSSRRRGTLTQCRPLLAHPPIDDDPPESVVGLMARLTGVDVSRCPVCGEGRMQITAIVGRVARPPPDTS